MADLHTAIADFIWFASQCANT